MSTQTLPLVTSRKRMVWDRRFYLGMAIACAVVIFAGFSRTYFLRPHFRPMSPGLSVLVHVHALVFTAWMVYFVLQTALIAVNRPGLHRRLGITGAVLGTVMIVLGVSVSVTGMRLHHGNLAQSAEVIFLVGMIDILSFAIFFVLGYLWRRDREAHQRLMLLAVVVGLTGAAIGRLLPLGVPVAGLGVINLLLLFAGPVYDWATRRRIHRVYVYGVLWALVTFTPLRFAVGATPWWHRMAHVLAGM